MKRFFKHVVLGLLVIMFGIGLIGTQSVKAAEEEKTIVYVNAPTDWENPCIWAWADDGTNAFKAWPGKMMTKDKNNEGWYYLYIPKATSNIIINANQGTVQTAELKTEMKNQWITIKSAEEAVLSDTPQTKGELPEYVAEFAVSVRVPKDWEKPCLWAWSAPDGTNVFTSWPGEALFENPDGWYTYELPVWVNSVIVNANEGAIQTADLSVEAKDMWIVVNDDKTAEVTYTKPEVKVEMFKVHAMVPEDWLFPALWAWSAPDGTNVFANWPGEDLILEDDGWYTYEIPVWVNSIIINGNVGTVQTADLSVEGKELWVVVDESKEATITYEKPEIKKEEPAKDTPTPTPTEAVAKEEPKEEKESKPVVTEPEVETETETEESSNTVLIIVIIAAVVVAAGIIITVVVKKKKK